MISWRDLKPAPVCAALEARRTKNADGRASFSSADWDALTHALSGMINFPTSIPSFERYPLTIKAIFAAGREGAVTPSAVLSHLQNQIVNYLKRRTTEYVLLAHLALPREFKFRALSLRNSKIRLLPKTPSQFLNDAREQLSGIPSLTGRHIPHNFRCIQVTLTARSAMEAGERGLEEIDKIRAIWNLYFNRTLISRISDSDRPVNRIALGPVHIVYDTYGNAVPNICWYEPNFRNDVVLVEQNRLSRMKRFWMDAEKHLRQSRYRVAIDELLVRYVRALDQRNGAESFFQLWGILESLTGSVGDQHKVTVRRTCSLFLNREVVEQELHVLRLLRNRHAHVGEQPYGSEQCMVRLQSIVNRVLEFHIGNRFRFENLSEASEFLDLPLSRKQLERGKRLRQFALEFHRARAAKQSG